MSVLRYIIFTAFFLTSSLFGALKDEVYTDFDRAIMKRMGTLPSEQPTAYAESLATYLDSCFDFAKKGEANDFVRVVKMPRGRTQVKGHDFKTESEQVLPLCTLSDGHIVFSEQSEQHHFLETPFARLLYCLQECLPTVSDHVEVEMNQERWRFERNSGVTGSYIEGKRA